MPFARLEKLMRQEFGVPLRQVFSDFDERAFAAASIGQVHRARTVDGADVEDKHRPSELRLDGARCSHVVLSQIWK